MMVKFIPLNVVMYVISLQFPVMFPQITDRRAKVHKLPSVGTSVQVTVLCVVVVGQLPQFDARMS